MAGPPPLFEVSPPLINSACPWATTLDDLRKLYACPWTGAVTTRTSLINGFDHDPARHQYVFFDAADAGSTPNASLNSLGYSPLTLETYLGFIKTISDDQPAKSSKGFIVSVTGTPEDIAASYALIASAAPELQFPVAMEINLSCPNIPNQPAPAYSQEALTTYLTALQQAITSSDPIPRIPVGLKTPPYTYTTQFLALISALDRAADEDANKTCPISFITATNTLGSCLLFSSSSSSTPPPPSSPTLNNHDDQASPPSSPPPSTTPLTPLTPALPSSQANQNGLGGIAGAPLHPLALGNVATLRRLLDERVAAAAAGEGEARLRRVRVRIVGVGGVLDAAGYRRMRAAGADVVGVATGLGLRGVGVFEGVGRGVLGDGGGGGGW